MANIGSRSSVSSCSSSSSVATSTPSQSPQNTPSIVDRHSRKIGLSSVGGDNRTGSIRALQEILDSEERFVFSVELIIKCYAPGLKKIASASHNPLTVQAWQFFETLLEATWNLRGDTFLQELYCLVGDFLTEDNFRRCVPVDLVNATLKLVVESLERLKGFFAQYLSTSERIEKLVSKFSRKSSFKTARAEADRLRQSKGYPDHISTGVLDCFNVMHRRAIPSIFVVSLANWETLENGIYKEVAQSWSTRLYNMAKELNGDKRKVIELMHERTRWEFNHTRLGAPDLLVCAREEPIKVREAWESGKEYNFFVTSRAVILTHPEDNLIEYILPLGWVNTAGVGDLLSFDDGAEEKTLNLDVSYPLKCKASEYALLRDAITSNAQDAKKTRINIINNSQHGLPPQNANKKATSFDSFFSPLPEDFEGDIVFEFSPISPGLRKRSFSPRSITSPNAPTNSKASRAYHQQHQKHHYQFDSNSSPVPTLATEPVPLHDTASAPAPPAPAAEVSTRSLQLVVQEPNSLEDKMVEISPSSLPFMVGTDTSCDLVINNEHSWVSPVHLLFFEKGNSVMCKVMGPARSITTGSEIEKGSQFVVAGEHMHLMLGDCYQYVSVQITTKA